MRQGIMRYGFSHGLLVSLLPSVFLWCMPN